MQNVFFFFLYDNFVFSIYVYRIENAEILN